MPNWCENQISIQSTDKKVIDHIHDVIMSDDDYNLMGLRREPENVDDLHNWRYNNWGTKWSLTINTYNRNHLGEHYEIWMNADSAWSPPLELLQYITEVHPVEISCSYQESMMDFIGYAHFENGQMGVSEGSITDNLPDDFDWDNDDCDEVYNDTVDRLLCEHETLALQELALQEMAS